MLSRVTERLEDSPMVSQKTTEAQELTGSRAASLSLIHAHTRIHTLVLSGN